MEPGHITYADLHYQGSCAWGLVVFALIAGGIISLLMSLYYLVKLIILIS